ncbi:MAG: aspartate carbamoyltransferase catalytic subunit [Erysipelotrichia bacterium]|nr:aspartate carbamoyltransferase catalytic subunit [Erysipelotrichia bacterium]NCC54174.1 aspartate carbamoyltransferase catalytic subunit [Erysipelotrichia bacterium]
MNQNSILTMNYLSIDEIMGILDDAMSFSCSHKDWQLSKPRLIANLFFEPSTRTHYSFASAEHQLGCKVVDFMAEASSTKKGETLYDTVKTFEMIGYEGVVIRHREDQYFKELEGINISIINAGDGCENHPSQCLLDMLTIYQEFKTFKDIKLVIVGDINHSRVANSNVDTMKRLGGEVRFSGPEFWIDRKDLYMPLDEAIEWADAVMMLRIQHERHSKAMNMTTDEYLAKYGLTHERVARMKKHAIIMHPAPVNRGVEIASDLVEHPKSRIFKQMENGVLVRKAMIKKVFNESF